MPNYTWMIYGATGFTGVLIAEEALKRGHQPILAGRNRDKLAPLAKRLGLKYMVFGLEDVNTIAQAIADVDVVFHAAGPFIETSDPMIRACLATGTHYLDITGEIAVFENTFQYHETALKNRIALIGGVGFDVVPTDCLALHVAQKVKGAHTLEIAFQTHSNLTAGTAKSVIVNAPGGAQVRREGNYEKINLGSGGRMVRYSNGEFYSVPFPWGDLATGYRSTGIPNITVYMAMPRSAALISRIASPLLQGISRNAWVKQQLVRWAERTFKGPNAALQQSGRTYLWARASNKEGTITAEAWLETIEGYRLTAEMGIRAVELTAEYHPVGALTPAQAFGADFILEAPDTRRMDRLG